MPKITKISWFASYNVQHQCRVVFRHGVFITDVRLSDLLAVKLDRQRRTPNRRWWLSIKFLTTLISCDVHWHSTAVSTAFGYGKTTHRLNGLFLSQNFVTRIDASQLLFVITLKLHNFVMLIQLITSLHILQQDGEHRVCITQRKQTRCFYHTSTATEFRKFSVSPVS